MLVENLEELLDFSLQKIIEPLDQIGPKSPIAQVFPHSPPHSPPRIVAGIVNQAMGRARGPLNLAVSLYDLPKHPERVLLKFDPRKRYFCGR